MLRCKTTTNKYKVTGCTTVIYCLSGLTSSTSLLLTIETVSRWLWLNSPHFSLHFSLFFKSWACSPPITKADCQFRSGSLSSWRAFFSCCDLALLSRPSSPPLLRLDQVLRLRTTWVYPSLPLQINTRSKYTLGLPLQHPATPLHILCLPCDMQHRLTYYLVHPDHPHHTSLHTKILTNFFKFVYYKVPLHYSLDH